MKQNIFKARHLSLFFAVAVATQLFQNCGQLPGLDEGFYVGASTGVNDVGHPSAKSATPPKKQTLLVNKKYVEALLRDLFTSTAYPVPGLENLLLAWAGNRPGQFGGGCDPYGSFTGADCGGSISGAGGKMHVDDNSLRESYVIQLCENLLGTDNGVMAVLEKVPSRAEAPTALALAEVYELFFRGLSPSSAEIDSLLDSDRSLAKKGESSLERWRASILQVCESPAWQLQ